MKCPEEKCALPEKHEGNHLPGPVVTIFYCNWKGVSRYRRIVPTGQIMFQASPPWHSKPQWLIGAIDCEDGGHKWWGMEGISSWREG